jgi:hypothetical protein
MESSRICRNTRTFDYNKVQEKGGEDIVKNATAIQILNSEDEKVFRGLLEKVQGDFIAATRLELASISVHYNDATAAPLPLLLAQRMPRLTSLELGHFSIDHQPRADLLTPGQIFEQLLTGRKLEDLTCAKWKLNPGGCEWLVDTLQKCAGSKKLALDHCSGRIHVMWSGEDIEPNYANVLIALDALGRLDGLDAEAQEDLVIDAAEDCRKARRPGIDYTGQVPFTQEELIKLTRIPGLQELDLSGCNFVDGSLAPLLESLADNPPLETPRLQGNTLGKGSLHALAGALRKNETLASLTFSWGGTDGELEPLVAALKDNHTLSELTIHCAAPGANCLALLSMVQGNKQRQSDVRAKVTMLVVDEARS